MDELDDRWQLDLAGYEVTQCCVDYAVTFLLLSPDRKSASIIIEGACSYRDATGETHQIGADAVGPSFAPLLALMAHTVKRAEAFKNGSLLLAFVAGDELWVDADPKFEPWHITTENGLRVVSIPGGDLAIWFPEDPTRE